VSCPKCGGELAETIWWEDGKRVGTIRSCGCGFRQNVPSPQEPARLPKEQRRLGE